MKWNRLGGSRKDIPAPFFCDVGVWVSLARGARQRNAVVVALYRSTLVY